MKRKPIGAGSYGCTFDVVETCNDKEKETVISEAIKSLKRRGWKRFVSKHFFSDSEALKEVERFNTMIDMDVGNKFTVPWVKLLCRPNQYKRSDIEECPSTTRYPDGKPKYQMISAYGGEIIPVIEVRNAVTNKKKTEVNAFAKKTKSMWDALTPLLRGLSIMSAEGWVHHDIKHDNLLFIDSPKRFNLIDFGLMERFKHIRFVSNDDQRKHYWYPPELYACVSKERFVSHFKTSSIEVAHMNTFNYNTKEIETLFGSLQKRTDVALRISTDEYQPYEYNAFATKFDIYGLGFIFWEFVYYSGLAAHAIREKHANALVICKMLLLSLYMSHPNVSRRCTPTQSLQLYTDLTPLKTIHESIVVFQKQTGGLKVPKDIMNLLREHDMLHNEFKSSSRRLSSQIFKSSSAPRTRTQSQK